MARYLMLLTGCPALCIICDAPIRLDLDCEDGYTVPADCCEGMCMCCDCRQPGNHDCEDF